MAFKMARTHFPLLTQKCSALIKLVDSHLILFLGQGRKKFFDWCKGNISFRKEFVYSKVSSSFFGDNFYFLVLGFIEGI